MSATLPPCMCNDVLNKLQFDKNNFVNINLGNDCQNVSIIIQAIHNAMNTYSDLNFLIPIGVTKPSQVPRVFVYVDNVAVGVDIEGRLYERSPQSFQDAGIIHPYGAAFSPVYQANVMVLFKAGVVQILICMDAAGMVISLQRSRSVSEMQNTTQDQSKSFGF